MPARRKPEDADNDSGREKALAFLFAELQKRDSSPAYKRRKGIFLLIIAVGSFAAIFTGSHALPLMLGPSCAGAHPTSRPSIALIDEMSVEHPNPDLASNISATAKTAGYRFDYFPSKTADLNFFVNLPDLDYSIVILRTHGTGLVATDPTLIVSSETYNQSTHIIDQFTNRVSAVEVNGTIYFAMGPSFVSDAMCGKFHGTLVLAMFCEGALLTSLAKAFTDKGAGAYIGWDRVVSVVHTDRVFESLVTLLLTGKTVNISVQDAMNTLGPDPFSGARLVSYDPQSFPADPGQIIQQYWYIISAGLVVVIFGLAKVRNAKKKTLCGVSFY